MLTGSPFLSSCCFILLVNSLLAHLSRSSTLPKNLAQAEAFSDDYSKKLQSGTEWGGEKELSVRTWGSARTPPAFRLSSLIPGSHPFSDCKNYIKHCCIFSSYYFPTLSTLPSIPVLPRVSSWASDNMSSPT